MAKTRKPKNTEEGAALAKMLGDPTRMSIVVRLAFTGPASVNTICEEMALPQPTVSHHLGLLRMSRVVEARRQGKQVFYSVHHNLAKSDGFAVLKALLAKLGG